MWFLYLLFVLSPTFLCEYFRYVNNGFENERLMISTVYFFVLMFTYFAQENETKYMYTIQCTLYILCIYALCEAWLGSGKGKMEAAKDVPYRQDCHELLSCGLESSPLQYYNIIAHCAQLRIAHNIIISLRTAQSYVRSEPGCRSSRPLPSLRSRPF